MNAPSHHLDPAPEASRTPSRARWVLAGLGIGSAVVGAGAIGVAVVVALIGMSLTFEGCELESPPTTGRAWCREQRPARPFLTMVNEATTGVFPTKKAGTFTIGMFSSITGASEEVNSDRTTIFEALVPNAKPAGSHIPADQAPAVQASALRLDGYCARMER